MITRAIAALESNTGPSRAALYDRLRRNLQAATFSESTIEKERFSLERAIRSIELQEQAKRYSRRVPYNLTNASRPEPPVLLNTTAAKRNKGWIITMVLLIVFMNVTGATLLWLLMHLMTNYVPAHATDRSPIVVVGTSTTKQ